MPEVLNKPSVEEDPAAVQNNSNTESDSDNDSIPELEESKFDGGAKSEVILHCFEQMGCS